MNQDKFIVASTDEQIKLIQKNQVTVIDEDGNVYFINYSDIAALISISMSDLEIYDDNETLLCNTYGCFLNKCDSTFRAEIIEDLISYQRQEKEVETIYYLDSEVSE